MATMAGKRDYYEILGVQKDASEKVIASAYRKLAMKFHPDANLGDDSATEKFKEAAEAYEILRDREKRARYDQFGHQGVDGSAPHFTDVEDIFEAFGDMFSGGLFGDLFARRRGGRRQRKGSDIRCDVALELEEAARGVTRTVEFTRSKRCSKCDGKGSKPGSVAEPCRRCGGHGQVVQSAGFVRVQTTCPACQGAGSVITNPCDECRGHGYVAANVKMDVAIPAGVDDGMRVRLTGEGEPSPDGGPAGDCYCFITIRPHSIFKRDGKNLVLQMPITYTQAALGASLEVPTFHGREELTIPAGTQHGELFRIRLRGLPDPRGGSVGDLIVQTLLEVPRKLSNKQEAVLRQLAEIEKTDVTPHRKSFLAKIKDYFAPGEGEHSIAE